jgi:hypothetical protein
MLSPFRDIMNNEVTRLRKLRKTVLKVRALASALNSGNDQNRVYEHAGVLNWRIARVATGRLRSHPYRSYQADQGYLESTADRLDAYIQGKLANMRGQGTRIFLQALSVALREVDDARALTLSTDLSDALGRAQQAMRSLIDDVRAQLPKNLGQHVDDRGKPGTSGLPVSHAAASSYLAL